MAEKLEIEYININLITPYEKNPRKNDSGVDVVAKSIKEFGFKNPIIIDKNNNIIAGHTRLKAAKSLGIMEVPTIKAEDLTENQIKAFRIMDNRSSEFSTWDNELLSMEFDELKTAGYDIGMTGFNLGDMEKLDIVNSNDDEWVGMPEFDKKDETLKVIIHFDTEEDRKEFDKKYPLTYIKKQEKSWSAWYPPKEREDTGSLKYE